MFATLVCAGQNARLPLFPSNVSLAINETLQFSLDSTPALRVGTGSVACGTCSRSICWVCVVVSHSYTCNWGPRPPGSGHTCGPASSVLRLRPCSWVKGDTVELASEWWQGNVFDSAVAILTRALDTFCQYVSYYMVFISLNWSILHVGKHTTVFLVVMYEVDKDGLQNCYLAFRGLNGAQHEPLPWITQVYYYFLTALLFTIPYSLN